MRRLSPLEGITIIFLGIVLLLTLLFYPRFPHGWLVLSQFSLLVLLAVGIWRLRERWDGRGVVGPVCDFSPIFFVIVVYELLGGFIPYLHPDVDEFLIKVDLVLLGVHPTVWLERFSHPWLTDFLALAYASYYFIPVILIIILYVRAKGGGFSLTIFTLLLGYYISYVGYIAMPTIGPRFTLVSLQGLPINGGAITDSVIHIINLLEHNRRDCFPSGHTQMTLISLWFAFRYRRSLFWVYLPVSAVLIFSTVYLRYHYVIDVAAGFACAGATILIGPRLLAWWVRGMSERSGRSYIVSRPGPRSPSA